MSDNGACAEWDPYGFEYPDFNDRVAGGTPGHPSNTYSGDSVKMLGGPDGPLFSYGSGWANASNTPFTLYKQFVHEGGISSPLIIHWPAQIKESLLFTDRYAHITDIMVTCISVAGAEYPEYFNGHEITPLEGIDLFNTLAGEADPERVLTFEHSGNPAIRTGDWKLVASGGAMGKESFNEDADFQLYNIAEDRSETVNLAPLYPEKVKEMKQIMLDEFIRTRVFPRPY
jgi:arylsulfatase